MNVRHSIFVAPVSFFLMIGFLVSCANDGIPKSWDDQPDESGKGLAIRNFEDACIEADGSRNAKATCGCVLSELLLEDDYEKFKNLDDFISKHRDELTSEILSENFGWFTSIVETCSN